MRQTMNDVTLETMLTIRQVADFLHVSISTVRRWSDSRILKSYRIGPRGDRRYLRDDVLSFLDESALNLREDKEMEKDGTALPGGERSVAEKGAGHG